MAGLVDLSSMDVSAPGVVIVTTGQGGEITFGLENLEQQLSRWREIYDLARSRNKVIASAGSGGVQQCAGALDGRERRASRAAE